MIPEFPQFKNLALEDKEHIEKITKLHPPYSDFNFVSMWSWDTYGEMRVSLLHYNLVVRFTDYITGKPFYSFLGVNNVNLTAQKILDLSQEESLPAQLKLIPECVVNHLNSQYFKIEEDQDNFDYIYDIEILSRYNGNKLRAKRNFCNRFKRSYTAEIKIIDISNLNIQQQIKQLCQVWCDNKNFTTEEKRNEFMAIDRVFQIVDKNLISVGLFYEQKLIGFIINEIVDEHHIILHFEKADDKYVGVYAYLMQENCRILAQLGKKVLNFEQDLGIPGLRAGKKSYMPQSFLKKYIVSCS